MSNKSCCYAVRDVSDGAIFSIGQDLGPGSAACNLDPAGLAQACHAVECAIARGVDLVILSKFGKLEAQRRGLTDAFRAAFAARLPILTSVSPSCHRLGQSLRDPSRSSWPPTGATLIRGGRW
jgi:Protein of unknown function (DUF2478)